MSFTRGSFRIPAPRARCATTKIGSSNDEHLDDRADIARAVIVVPDYHRDAVTQRPASGERRAAGEGVNLMPGDGCAPVYL